MRKIPHLRIQRSTSKDVFVISLDALVRPDRQKDPDWLAKTEAQFPSRREFLREHARAWNQPVGLCYYPEWSERGESLYVHQIDTLMEGFVWRGWDFGHRFPSCAWAQWDPHARRLFLIRSILSAKDLRLPTPTDSFRDLVRYLSGEVGIEAISEDDAAMEWLGNIENLDSVPTPPWFAEGTQFLDFSGHEAMQERAEVSKESAERNHAQILEAGGVYLNAYYSTVKARETAMRDLLKVREDGWPGLIVDPGNPQFLDGMRGGFAYPKASKAVPIPNKPKKDGYYDNIHDAVGYIAVNAVKAEEVQEEIQTRRPIAKASSRPEVADTGTESYAS